MHMNNDVRKLNRDSASNAMKLQFHTRLYGQTIHQFIIYDTI